MNKETTKQLLYKREEKRLKRFLKTKINTRKTIVKDSPLNGWRKKLFHSRNLHGVL